jgi:hypothetical protein
MRGGSSLAKELSLGWGSDTNHGANRAHHVEKVKHSVEVSMLGGRHEFAKGNTDQNVGGG